jgi:hypothetical protein
MMSLLGYISLPPTIGFFAATANDAAASANTENVLKSFMGDFLFNLPFMSAYAGGSGSDLAVARMLLLCYDGIFKTGKP